MVSARTARRGPALGGRAEGSIARGRALTSRGAPSAPSFAVARFRRDVLAGLSAVPRSIPSKYFYDAKGSRLFQRIMTLEEYYPTRSEQEILETHGDRIVTSFRGRESTVVDLGAGDGTKTRSLLSRLYRRCPGLSYAPIDVSLAALSESCARMTADFPGIQVRPVMAEYAEGLRWLRVRAGNQPLLVLFLGSNIGNLERPEARGFLKTLRAALRAGDHVLVGFDLMKELAVLRRAYDDAQGVTAAFNLNLLERMNRELGANFEPSSFAHRATFDPGRLAMESWLQSLKDQTVTVAGKRFAFFDGEAIHTEVSCKYRESDVTEFAAAAGFAEVAHLHDRRGWFVDALWRVPGRGPDP